MWSLEKIGTIVGVAGVFATGCAYIHRCFAEHRRKVELEKYLWDRKKNHSTWQHSIDHLILNTKLSREQIEKAAKTSAKISRIPRVDKNGMAISYRLEWKGKP